MNTSNSQSALKTILLAGFVAGLLDITAAVVKYAIERQQEPTRLFQFIASGVFGRDAFAGGWMMAAWGLIFHFAIAYIFTIIFFLLYPRIQLLWKNRIITGLVYGIIAWCIMNLVVLPLSNTPGLAFNPIQAIIGMVILMFCIGLPIALIVHRYYARNKSVSR